MNKHWLDRITAALAAQPPGRSAVDAVAGAFADLGRGFGEIEEQVRELATLTRSSETLDAWTLRIYVRYEAAIAELIAPRIGGAAQHDPRPRLIGALAMAAVRLALDDWLRDGDRCPIGYAADWRQSPSPRSCSGLAYVEARTMRRPIPDGSPNGALRYPIRSKSAARAISATARGSNCTVVNGDCSPTPSGWRRRR